MNGHFWLPVLVIWAGLSIASSAEDKPLLAEILKQKQSLYVAQESLERVLMELAAKVQAKHPQFAIKIVAKDLQFEGITRNQQLRNLEEIDQPLEEILTRLVLAANPNRNVKGAADPEQRLIWIVGKDPDEPKNSIILITTRAAAKRRGDELPPIFQAK